MGSIVGEGGAIFFDASYLTNFLDDFMLGLLTVLGKWPADEHKDKFEMEEEPAFSLWDVSLDEGSFVFHVVTYESYTERKVIDDKTVKVKREQFLADFISEMSDVLKRFGLFGFRSEWHYFEFPLSLFLMIKDAAGGNSLEVMENDGATNCGMEYESTDFVAELRAIQSILIE